ncbi:MAG: hypothetical protein EAZ89_08785 [Bacteroidetes bacterium]|nr:MAG: hypothetical protein EAZ89_08785 [Bacteroidota bacterium]
MKKVLSLITVLMFALAGIAQETIAVPAQTLTVSPRKTSIPTQRGNFVFGSRIGFSAARSSIDVQSSAGSVKGDGGSSSQFNLSPAIGYFLATNFVVGISMDWLRNSSSTGVDLNGGTTPPQTSNNDNLLFGPFIRYFLPLDYDKAFFIGTTVGFGNSQNQFTSDNTTQSIDNSLLTIGAGPGFTIFSSNGLALEALVKYNFAQSISQIDVQGVSRTSKTWTNAIDFSVGLQYYFGGFKSVTK